MFFDVVFSGQKTSSTAAEQQQRICSACRHKAKPLANPQAWAPREYISSRLHRMLQGPKQFLSSYTFHESTAGSFWLDFPWCVCCGIACAGIAIRPVTTSFVTAQFFFADRHAGK
ncbi:hypothetical protein GUJ93_ZPchr0499g26855 [Zizania palustris]|uniref:Uncharacterized protein n=1 Tax=Zizania palustris TaxID=103762 RepID=A0A8J5RER4_ZIZPA|nr:hypothetical protein GUJ93_ZPchr0499g26855 [Zizania palustris]